MNYYKKKSNILPAMFIIFIILLPNINIKEFKNTIIFIISIIILFLILILFFLYIQKSKERKRYLSSGIDTIDQMKGIEFEHLLNYYFKELGYKSQMTKATNDYGADLILKKDGDTVIVQAKRYNSKIGIKAVQEAIGAVTYYSADKGMVITNNYFTKQAITLAKSAEIELWDREKIIRIMSNFNNN